MKLYISKVESSALYTFLEMHTCTCTKQITNKKYQFLNPLSNNKREYMYAKSRKGLSSVGQNQKNFKVPEKF